MCYKTQSVVMGTRWVKNVMMGTQIVMMAAVICVQCRLIGTVRIMWVMLLCVHFCVVMQLMMGSNVMMGMIIILMDVMGSVGWKMVGYVLGCLLFVFILVVMGELIVANSVMMGIWCLWMGAVVHVMRRKVGYAGRYHPHVTQYVGIVRGMVMSSVIMGHLMRGMAALTTANKN